MEDDEDEEEIEDSEEQTESEIDTPESSTNPIATTSLEFTDSSLNPRSSVESSEMVV